MDALYPGQARKPAVAAHVTFAGNVLLIINDPKTMEEVYTRNRKFHSKHWIGKAVFGNVVPNSFLFQGTEEPDWLPKRRALGQAFFKDKMVEMCEVFKIVAYKHFRSTED